MARFRLRKLFIRSGHGTPLGQIVTEKLFQAFHGAVAVFRDRRMIINMSKQESLQRRVLCRNVFAEPCKPLRSPAKFLRRRNAGCLRASLRILDQISDQQIQDVLERFVEFQFLPCSRMRLVHGQVSPAKKANFSGQDAEIEKSGFQGIVHVSRVVRNFVHPIDELCFERSPGKSR